MGHESAIFSVPRTGALELYRGRGDSWSADAGAPVGLTDDQCYCMRHLKKLRVPNPVLGTAHLGEFYPHTIGILALGVRCMRVRVLGEWPTKTAWSG
jgi:hypothetical protein